MLDLERTTDNQVFLLIFSVEVMIALYHLGMVRSLQALQLLLDPTLPPGQVPLIRYQKPLSQINFRRLWPWSNLG